jgi:hypothetical protein
MIAEYCALAEVTKEVMWLRKLAVVLNLETDTTTPVNINSNNAIKLIKKPGYSATTRWLSNCYYFVKEAIANKDIELNHIPGDINPVDQVRGICGTVRNKKPGY